MAFTNNFRIERVYFERLKTMIDVLKAFKDNVTDEPTRTLLENSIDVDGATLLLYRNLGEAWAELADLIQKTRELLQSLDEKTEKYHDELNERIDEVNNYLMALIRALEARVDAIESDLAQMGRLFTYELTRANDSYTLTESGNPVTFSDTVAKYTHNRAHLVTVRGNVDGETTYFFPREYDTSTESGLFEWYAFGFVGNEIHEITVTLLPDDTVNVAIETTNFTTILSRLSALETSVNSLIQRMTNAEADIDTLEATAENLEANKQDKLVAGSGISIDPETNEITNTAQGEEYAEGSAILIDENNNINSYFRGIATGLTSRKLPAKFGSVNITKSKKGYCISGVCSFSITHEANVKMCDYSMDITSIATFVQRFLTAINRTSEEVYIKIYKKLICSISDIHVGESIYIATAYVAENSTATTPNIITMDDSDIVVPLENFTALLPQKTLALTQRFLVEVETPIDLSNLDTTSYTFAFSALKEIGQYTYT